MKEFIRNLKKLNKYCKGQKCKIILFFLFSLLMVTLTVVMPLINAKFIVLLTQNNFIRLFYMAIFLFLMEMGYDLFNYFAHRIKLKLFRDVLNELVIDLSKNILRIENKSLDSHGSGVFIQRLTGDASRLSEVIDITVLKFTNILRYIGIIIAIFIVNKLVFIYVIVLLIILFVLEHYKTLTKKENDKVYRLSKESASSFVIELVRGARDIKMLNSEKDFINELDNKIKESNSLGYKMQKTNLNYKLLIFSIRDLGEMISICLLVFLISRNIIDYAIALVLYNYCNNTGGAINVIGDLLEYIKDFNLSCDRVFAIINSDEFKKEKFGKKKINKINGDFEFKNVSFGYDDNKVLDNLSFCVRANETVAFVGKSGAGKTTIFNLLCKMYNVDKGKITIDGIDINKLDKDSIRGNITIINQDPYIFNVSIRDNLRLVKNNVTDEEIKSACRMACLDDFINTLPMGYDTMVGEGGINLSGGQKQRLAIARALVQKTEIILFDEATSALDNETQEKIKQAINNMKHEYTILIIAHRLSTIASADRILFLSDGKIMCEGSHSYLLKNCPEYRHLYEAEISKD